MRRDVIVNLLLLCVIFTFAFMLATFGQHSRDVLDNRQAILDSVPTTEEGDGSSTGTLAGGSTDIKPPESGFTPPPSGPRFVPFGAKEIFRTILTPPTPTPTPVITVAPPPPLSDIVEKTLELNGIVSQFVFVTRKDNNESTTLEVGKGSVVVPWAGDQFFTITVTRIDPLKFECDFTSDKHAGQVYNKKMF